MGLFGKNGKGESLWPNLVRKLECQKAGKWSVEEFDQEVTYYTVRKYSTNIRGFEIWLSHIIDPNNVHCQWELNVFDCKGIGVAEFSGEVVQNLYLDIDKKLRGVVKSRREIVDEQRILDKQEEEKARQKSLRKLRRIL
jgi:hypothetical protein